MTRTESADLGSEGVEAKAAPPLRWGRVWPWLVAAGLIVGVLAFRRGGAKAAALEAAGGRDAARAVPVQISPSRTGDVPIYLRGLGTATAFNSALVRSRVDGQLVDVPVREGQSVSEGDVLARIDPRPFEVQVEQAQGQLARDEATLHDARVNLERMQALYDDSILPKQQLDSQRSQVEQLEGAIKGDEATLHGARLQLSYSRVQAPFSGRVGLRLLDPGNMVHANDASGLLVLTQVHPIAVVFSLPQDDLGEVLAKLKSGATLEVEAFDRDNAVRVATGKLVSVDNQIDSATGTYKLKAVFDNKDDALFPNQFVNARLHLDTKRGLVLFPSPALQRGPQGTFVYVVGPDLVAKVRPVTVALSEGADTAASAGLEAGENVVVDGQDKLREGSKVDLGSGGKGGAGKRGAASAKGDGGGETKPKREAR